MRRHVFIWKVIVTCAVICYACIAQTALAQTHELKKMKVGEHTMYSMTDSLYSAISFYYNDDILVQKFRSYGELSTEPDDAVINFLLNKLIDDMIDDTLVVSHAVGDILSTDDLECIMESPENKKIAMSLYIDLEGYIANVRLLLSSNLYNTCLDNYKIYRILNNVMECKLKLSTYKKELKRNAQAIAQYKDKGNLCIFFVNALRYYTTKERILKEKYHVE